MRLGKPSKLHVNPNFRQFRVLQHFVFVAVVAGFPATRIAAQQPAPPPTAANSAGQSQPGASAPESSKKQKEKIPPFLILGTVFTEHDYAFPGVRVRVRKKGEKKFRYEMHTDSRGEFAIRVPEGIEYEVVVTQKKYKEQSEEVAANIEEVQKRLTFKLEPSAPAKSGDSK